MWTTSKRGKQPAVTGSVFEGLPLTSSALVFQIAVQGDRSPPKQLFIWNGACNRAVHKSEKGLLLTSVRQWFGEPPRHYTGWQPPESNLRLTGVRQWFRTTAPLYRLPLDNRRLLDAWLKIGENIIIFVLNRRGTFLPHELPPWGGGGVDSGK